MPKINEPCSCLLRYKTQRQRSLMRPPKVGKSRSAKGVAKANVCNTWQKTEEVHVVEGKYFELKYLESRIWTIIKMHMRTWNSPPYLQACQFNKPVGLWHTMHYDKSKVWGTGRRIEPIESMLLVPPMGDLLQLQQCHLTCARRSLLAIKTPRTGPKSFWTFRNYIIYRIYSYIRWHSSYMFIHHILLIIATYRHPEPSRVQ